MNTDNKNEKGLLISHDALRQVIGYLGTGLPILLVLGGLFLGDGVQRTLSLYYHTGMRDIFVGFLCAIGLGFLSYRGYEKKDAVASNIACVLAFCIAFFPTDEDPDFTSLTGYAHLFFAGSFFTTLIYFSYFLFTKSAKGEAPTAQKIKRNKVYKTCAAIMATCILLISIYYLLPARVSDPLKTYNPVFWLESFAVVAFGVSWLTKGEVMLKDVYR